MAQNSSGPPGSFGQGGPASADSPRLAQYNALLAEPPLTINIPTTTTGKALIGRAGILIGWSLRETTGTASAVVEFIDGPDANGTVIGEQTVISPVSALSLNTDVELVGASSVAAATAVATLAGAAGATTWVSGFSVSGLGATAATNVQATLSGMVGNSIFYFIQVPAGVTTAITPFVVEFARPIPATAVNTLLQISVPSFGLGNTAVYAAIHGFQRTITAAAAAVAGTATETIPGGGALFVSGLFMRVISGSVTGAALVRI